MKHLVLIALILVGVPHAAVADDDTLQQIGDFLQIALPVAAGGATLFTNPEPGLLWDREGTTQFAKAYGTAWGTTYTLKFLSSKMRPNGENQTSFPSGHTMSAFAGAGFIDGRYGWKWGLPALGLAVLTGVSRVESNWHYADDVIAGASIGLMSNWYFVTPQKGRVSVIPTVGAEGVGMELTINPGDVRATTPWAGNRPRGPAFRFAFGPATVSQNEVLSKELGATRFDLDDFDKRNDPVTTASIEIDVPVASRGLLRMSYSPFEAKDFGTFSQDTQFGGVVFPAGEETISGWRMHNLYALYSYDLLSGDRGTLSVGGGAGLFSSYVKLEQDATGLQSQVDDYGTYPLASITGRWEFHRRWAAKAGAQGISIGGDHSLSALAGVTWQLDRYWDLALNYRYFNRDIETENLENDVQYHQLILELTRWW